MSGDARTIAPQVLAAAALFADAVMRDASPELIVAVQRAGGRFEVRVVDLAGEPRVELVGVVAGDEVVIGHVELRRTDRGSVN